MATRILAALSITTGGILIAAVVPSFVKGHEEHRVLQRIADQGEFLQSEWTPPTDECAHPERWQMLDPQTAELEVLDLLEALAKAVKPQLIVETRNLHRAQRHPDGPGPESQRVRANHHYRT